MDVEREHLVQVERLRELEFDPRRLMLPRTEAGECGLGGPLGVLPLAEEAGLMPSLTELVLEQGIAQCAAWRSTGACLTVSINISSSNLLDPGFTDLVRAALRRHRVPAAAVVVEITETTIIRDFERCKLAIEQLTDLGFGVSVDDVGAGFTSLAYLGSLPVTELKLDRTCISGLAEDERGRNVKLVRATIELGHIIDMVVVAEGIEDAATKALLARLGCDRAQGYFTGRPVPASEIVIHSAPPPAAPVLQRKADAAFVAMLARLPSGFDGEGTYPASQDFRGASVPESLFREAPNPSPKQRGS